MLQLPMPTRRAHPSPKSAGPPSTNPHGGIFLHYVMGWYPCGHLLLHILTAPSCFPTTSSSGTPTAQLQPAPSCFSTTYSSATPTAQFQPAPSCFPTTSSSGTLKITTAAALYLRHGRPELSRSTLR